MKTTLFATVQIKPGMMDAALAACVAVREPSLKEEGCIRYNFYVQPDSGHEIVFFEEWVDRAALDLHFTFPYFKEFGEKLGELAAGPPSIRVYEVTGYEDI